MAGTANPAASSIFLNILTEIRHIAAYLSSVPAIIIRLQTLFAIQYVTECNFIWPYTCHLNTGVQEFRMLFITNVNTRLLIEYSSYLLLSRVRGR